MRAREKGGCSVWLGIVVCYPLTRLADFRDRPRDRQLLHEVAERVMGRVRDLLAEVRGEQAPVGFVTPSGPELDGGQEL